MTNMVMSRQSRTVTLPGLQAVDEAARAILHAITEAGPDDPRWEKAGPLVSAAALRLREAIGAPVGGTSVGSPPVVRERDLATAARGLLSRNAHVENGAAARDFVRLAFEAAVALS